MGDVAPVEIVHWNPRGNLIGERLPVRRRINNFGDLIGPLLVEAMLRRRGLSRRTRSRRRAATRLLTVGSIIHLARDRDAVWGSGIRGGMAETEYRFATLDVRAVRGPLTRQFLAERRIDVPSVYGDPALLLPDMVPQMREWAAAKARSLLVIPNFADFDSAYARHGDICLNPRAGLLQCLKAIAQSESVVASSLHGIVVAESLGIPARLVVSAHESSLKYRDYYLGTGRDPIDPARSVEQAIRELPGAATPVTPDPALEQTFPYDLWDVMDPSGS